jgi:hypothetical protein
LAPVLPLLKALARSTRRGLPSAGALLSNNFILFVFLLTYEHPQAFRSFHLALGLLVLFPLSLDPMRSLPRERLALLPLTAWDRLRLRLGSLVLSPVLWVAGAILVLGGRRWAGLLWLALLIPVAANALALLGDRLRPGGIPRWRGIGLLPGRLGILVQKNLRELLHLLDTYLALLLAGVALFTLGLRGPRPPGLGASVTFMVVLALSTSAQQLFALDREAAGRYRLLPLRGWEVLLAKNLAWLLVLAPLIVLLDPLNGLATGWAVLSAGNLASIAKPGPQAPWRLVRGASLGYTAAQVLLMAAACAACSALGGWALVPAGLVWAGSLALGGRWFEGR